jgi:hypothetical protein
MASSLVAWLRRKPTYFQKRESRIRITDYKQSSEPHFSSSVNGNNIINLIGLLRLNEIQFG